MWKALALVVALTFFPSSGSVGQSVDKLLSDLPADRPVVLGAGTVSTQAGEYSPTLDIGTGQLFFMRRTPGVFDYTILESKYSDSGWTNVSVVSFSGVHRDAAPYLAPDARRLYFDSRRPADGLEEGSINVWYAEREDGDWSPPRLVESASTNAPQRGRAGRDEFGPAVTADGRLHFYSFRAPSRAGARYSVADGGGPVSDESGIPDPSAATFVSYLYLSPDGATALMDGQAEGRRDGDIFYSCKSEGGTWSDARELPLVNSRFGDGGAWMSPDGSLLLYSSNRPARRTDAGDADVYAIRTDELPVPCAD